MKNILLPTDFSDNSWNAIQYAVELFKDESIVLTQAIQDVKDIEKIFADFTKTFNVPASRTNNKIFNC